MRRRLIKLGVFLVLGAVVNVAVAWGISVLSPHRVELIRQGMYLFSDIPNWEPWVFSRPGVLVIDAEATTLVRPGQQKDPDLPPWSRALIPPTRQQVAAHVSFQEIVYGWPLVNLYMRVDTCVWPRRFENGIRLPWSGDLALPVGVIWPAALANTLIYAVTAPVFLGLWRIVDVRGKLRLRRQLCPRCAYPIGVSPVCTECGAPLKPKSAEAAA